MEIKYEYMKRHSKKVNPILIKSVNRKKNGVLRIRGGFAKKKKKIPIRKGILRERGDIYIYIYIYRYI